MEEILSQQYWGNSLQDYLIAAGIIALGTLAVRVLKKVILRRIRKWAEGTSSTSDNYIVDSIQRFGIPALYYFIIYTGLNYLDWAPKGERLIQIATGVVILFFCIRLISSLLNLGIRNYTLQHEHGEEKVKQLGGLMILINIALWIAAGVFFIDNLGYDVTAIITGLGIGGIAIALAAQNILGDLFNYFVIFFDRPFEVGDFIIVDDKMGSVEHIGIKTTRIRSLTGEQLVISNSNLTSARIHNHKRQELRRVVFTIDVEYETPLEKLRKLPEGLKRIVTAQQETKFDRAHFAVYKEWSLRFEVVYMVTNSDYNRYMDIQQEMNFQIYGLLEELGIRFAIPTQKIMLDRLIEQISIKDKRAANQFSTAHSIEQEKK
jgi:small-conductance mechanosensitive channel